MWRKVKKSSESVNDSFKICIEKMLAIGFIDKSEATNSTKYESSLPAFEKRRICYKQS